MRNLLGAKLDIEQGERRERLVNAQTALSAEHLNQLRRKGQFEEQEMERLNRPVSIDTLARRKGQFEEQEMERLNRPVSIDTLAPLVEGGQEGPMFKMMYRMAESQGLVDKSTGGLGTITMRDLGQLQQSMQSPEFVYP
jgi:hypothetical protein